jgi:hypothetical protein
VHCNQRWKERGKRNWKGKRKPLHGKRKSVKK